MELFLLGMALVAALSDRDNDKKKKKKNKKRKSSWNGWANSWSGKYWRDVDMWYSR